MDKKSKNSLPAIFGWFFDRIIENWATLSSGFIAGGGMAYLASLSEPIREFGPVGWGLIGFFSFFLVSFSLAGFGIWKEKLAVADFTQKSAKAASCNPLSPIHKYESINLSDFFHPYYKPVTNVRFENCDLMGPCNVYSEGGTFDHCGFSDCEIILVREDRPVKGGIHLGRPVFLDCHLYRLTFLMPIDHYNNLPEEMRRGLPVISDGRVGDI